MFGRDGYINKILGVEDAYRLSSGRIVLPKLEVITAAIFVLLFSTFVSQLLIALQGQLMLTRLNTQVT